MGLPPYIRAWNAAGSRLRHDGIPTAADLLGVGRRSLYKLMHSGCLTAVRLNQRLTLVEVASIVRYLDSQRLGPSSSGKEG